MMKNYSENRNYGVLTNGAVLNHCVPRRPPCLRRTATFAVHTHSNHITHCLQDTWNIVRIDLRLVLTKYVMEQWAPSETKVAKQQKKLSRFLEPEGLLPCSQGLDTDSDPEWMISVLIFPLCFIKVHLNIFSNLCLDLSRGLVPSSFPTKFLCIFLTSCVVHVPPSFILSPQLYVYYEAAHRAIFFIPLSLLFS
jgi:hypothetical protein